MTPIKQNETEPSASMNDPEYSDGGTHRQNDAGHFEYTIGNKLGNYKIISHLGDGTFGRTLKCQNLRDQ